MSTRPASRVPYLFLLLLALSAGVARAAAPARGARTDGRALTAAQGSHALHVAAHLRAPAHATVLPFVASSASFAIAPTVVSAAQRTEVRREDGRAAVRSPLPRSPPVPA